MSFRQLPFYAIALAILVVGLALAGVSANTLVIGLLVLACPLMMMFMMGGGMHGQDSSPPKADDRDQRSSHRQ